MRLSHRESPIVTRENLETYLAMLSSFKQRFDGLDGILEHIRQLVSTTEPHNSDLSPAEDLDEDWKAHITGMYETHFTRCYVQAVTALQHGLTHGRHRKEQGYVAPLSPVSASSYECCCHRDMDCELPILEGDPYFGLDSPQVGLYEGEAGGWQGYGSADD